LLQATAIYEPIHERLARVEDRLKELARNRFPFLSQMLGHVYEPAGKRLRPAITLLASNFHPHDGASVEIMATGVELLHIASLIHDDTVDASDFRRGKATISSLWGRNAAVLVGDYIFASSATFVCDTGHVGVIRRFSETIMELSRGELQELVGTFDHDQTLDGYYERIYDKTASLFSTAGESGAILSGAPDHHVRALKEYSCQLGIAFQIVDDILDFEGTVAEVGKPVGSDLAHGILTLPSLIAMERCGEDDPIRKFFQSPQDMELLAAAVDLVQQPPIIEAAYAIAEQRSRMAREALMTLPRNPSRDSLEELLAYVVARRS
jgi:geranylgeranyl pyrophosphate synthase